MYPATLLLSASLRCAPALDGVAHLYVLFAIEQDIKEAYIYLNCFNMTKK
jgi:hypothetical protein